MDAGFLSSPASALGFTGSIGFEGTGSQDDEVAINNPVTPELANAGAVTARVPGTAKLLFWAAIVYLAVYILHIATY